MTLMMLVYIVAGAAAIFALGWLFGHMHGAAMAWDKSIEIVRRYQRTAMVNDLLRDLEKAKEGKVDDEQNAE